MTDVKQLLEQATPLPWRFITDKSDPEGPHPVGVEHDHGGYPGQEGWVVRFDDDWSTDQWRNGELIVHAVNSLPAYEELAEAVERLDAAYESDAEGLDRDIEWEEAWSSVSAALSRLRGEK